jgi:hypothetical protein
MQDASALAVTQAIADPLASLERILHLSVVQNRRYVTFSEGPSDANQEIMISNPVVLGPDNILREDRRSSFRTSSGCRMGSTTPSTNR